MFVRVMCDIRIHFFFFFNDTATTEIYTLSLHDALPIYVVIDVEPTAGDGGGYEFVNKIVGGKIPREYIPSVDRSEEHTSELQSRQYLVCRLLLEKKKISKLKSATLRTHRSDRRSTT